MIVTKYHIPEDRLYTNSHEWILVDKDIGIVGITDYAQDKLGDIVFIELPDENIEVSMGAKIGEIESVKTVAELYSPVSGKIVEVNKSLIEKPEIVNEDPYNEGWIYKIKITDRDELDRLLNPLKYAELIKND
ncbi:TPA: glycine cleavage system protein GcvH [Candidatus Geothermarchaeota archaeon]|nr:glycine cleavage system protein GcvH [Candidatus Geothermarchaeota archaeon]